MDTLHDKWYKMVPCGKRVFAVTETLQMGVYHFSGLFVLLCIGFGGSLLTSLGEHTFFHLILPRMKKKKKFKYWLHTSQKIHWALNDCFEDNPKALPEERSDPKRAQELPPNPSRADTRAKWSNLRRAVAKENRRVHFNLEKTSEAPGESDQDVEGSTAHCENGRPPQLEDGNPSQRELNELDLKIIKMREQLRAALVRKSELMSCLGTPLNSLCLPACKESKEDR